MKQFTEVRVPGTSQSWWSAKGIDMKVNGVVLERGKHTIVNIAIGSAASVSIFQCGSQRGDFEVQYHIKHCDGSHSAGNIIMDRADLARAFGLVNGFGHGFSHGGAALREMGYELDAASQGKYVRLGDYLNIPHPGTGLVGDPNVSVQIKAEMKSAVQSLLDFTAVKAV